jgi:hypothetical protein
VVIERVTLATDDNTGFDLRHLNFAEILRQEDRNGNAKWMSPYLHHKMQSCQRRANLSSMAKERLEHQRMSMENNYTTQIVIINTTTSAPVPDPPNASVIVKSEPVAPPRRDEEPSALSQAIEAKAVKQFERGGGKATVRPRTQQAPRKRAEVVAAKVETVN